ncbi:hypothetical protein F5141DRAFT_1068370 [Pisolithus sp. B1]|nr:hypothetical protein F5141DRAFT_1068370 [Pisolithus sp. B1]
MSSRRAFNILPSMIHLQAFYWLKQFMEGSILLDTALDSIEFTLGSNFKSDQWMNLTHCIVMEPDCWPAIEKIFMQELGIVGLSSVFEPLSPELHSQPSRVLTMSDTQESSSSTKARASPPSVSGIQESSSSTARAPLPSALTPSAVPLLKDPSAWRLMMDWAQDKIGFSELDDRMQAYGPRYIPEEWKVLIDEAFMLSDPGVESTSSPSLVVERAMESQGISLSAAPPTPSFRASTRSTSSSQSATRCRRKSCGVTQNKRHKLNSSIFLDIDAEDEGEEDEGEEEEEDEEGRHNYGPQQVGPLGKGSYLWTIDTLCERFHRGAWEATVSNDPLVTQLPTSIFLPPRNNIYIVEFYSDYHQPVQERSLLNTSRRKGSRSRHYLGSLTDFIKKLFFCHRRKACRSWYTKLGKYFQPEIGFGSSSQHTRVILDLDFVPILSPSGAEIGYSCSGQQFELRRVFKIGDTVEVIAGLFCGEMGYVVTLHEHTLVLVVMQPDKTSDNIEVSKFVVQSQLPEHILSLGPEDNEPRLVHPLPGDEALPGIIEWIGSDGKVWVFMHRKGKGKEDVLADEENPAPSQTVVAMNVSDLRIERPPNTLTFTKDKGYNVAVGDTVEVVRGQWRDSQGIVKAVDLTKASLDIVRPTDGVQINVPITFSRKIMERFEHGLSKFIGRDVWVIAGDKKGSWAMLHTIGRMSSWVGLFGQPIQLKNNQIATLLGMLLNGTLLPPQLQHALKALHSRSFITPVVPRSVTPPPSPGPSNVGLSDAWTITPADITQMQTPDYVTKVSTGDVPWLFEPDFCDFKSFHLGFNVSVGFTQVSLGKCIVRMVCPNRFTGQNGSAPPGSICITVTRHNAGLAIQHLTIPARYLKPANPTGKNQLCLILKGPRAGQVVRVKKCQRASKSVVTEDGITIHFSDVAIYQSSQGQDLALGSPPNISHTASLVEVTQKCKFCEDRDLALGPPLKISRGTSLTIQTSAINIQPISPVPPVIVSLKRKASEDQDLALAHPAKIPRIPSLVDPANLPPIGSSCFIWQLPNELLAHITTLLPRNSLLALTQACQLLREITVPHFFALLGFDAPQSNYLSLDDDG